MPIKKIPIDEFLTLGNDYPVLDVRSSGEYAQAHIPGAYSLPLFSDEERKEVGTAYKQQSRETAIKIGLDFFGVKMRKMVEEVESIVQSRKSGVKHESTPAPDSRLLTPDSILVHCWRGGMRSAAIAWLLDLYGFKVYLLTGGYKAYRKWVLAQFEKKYDFNIIGGYTGSGKTPLLHELKCQGKTVIDLEDLAKHKGSAFGAMENTPQPRQEMFENELAHALSKTNLDLPATEISATVIYLEDESQRIGNLQIPMPLWHSMRRSPLFFVDIPFEERLKYIVEDYGKQKKEYLANAIMRIQKRLGGLETKYALQHLEDGDITACFRILLAYYDKWYHKGLHNRENIESLLNKIPCTSVDTKTNTQKILTCRTINA